MRFPSTDATRTTPPPRLIELPVRVLLVVGVTVFALRDRASAAFRVRLVRDQLHVRRVDAERVPAEVINLHPVGDRADEDDPGDAMRERGRKRRVAELAVAVAEARGSPDP